MTDIKFTLCHRMGGSWSIDEMDRINAALKTEIEYMVHISEYIAIVGVFDEDTVSRAIGGGEPFTVTIMGYDELPWRTKRR